MPATAPPSNSVHASKPAITHAVPQMRDQHQQQQVTTIAHLPRLVNEQQTQINPKMLPNSTMAIEEDIQTPHSLISQPVSSNSSISSLQSSDLDDLDQESADVTMGAKESAINKKLIEAKKVFTKKLEKIKKILQMPLATPARTQLERATTTKRSQRHTSKAAFALLKAESQPPVLTQKSLMEKQLPGEVEYEILDDEEEKKQQLQQCATVTNKQSSDSEYIDDYDSSSDHEEQKKRKYQSASRELNNLQKGRASQQLNEELRKQSTQRKLRIKTLQRTDEASLAGLTPINQEFTIDQVTVIETASADQQPHQRIYMRSRSVLTNPNPIPQSFGPPPLLYSGLIASPEVLRSRSSQPLSAILVRFATQRCAQTDPSSEYHRWHRCSFAAPKSELSPNSIFF
ncbi:MAG: hypothetical protein EZS28_025788 [Streblomastix strix]|uniref:Uncharacterized protein n=1 Tax=Streblomastix strix TaxID=222440 RepID=A0A5J4V878_9EUKA|nr:MAG: hypothetical protein EZS28_025788 [Streblomastix strix]